MTCETSGTCGTGGYAGPQPGDPDNNVVLTATPAFGGIDVNWSYPGVNPHAVAYVILYRGDNASFTGAIERVKVGGNFFYDKVNANQTYYYWIKIVSIYGTVGEPVGPASATARPLIADLMEELTGKIDDGLLATTLKGTLDQISTLNTNLANEVFDRETGETSWAEALEQVQAGVAEAHTFILNEIETRTTNEGVFAETINGQMVVLNDQVSATTLTMNNFIDETNDTIGAMLVAKVTVNGLIGGFGVWNDGATVQAGFDVDEFWIGRTGIGPGKDGIKPFIIEGGVVYINEAAINKLTFSKLRDESGSFIVEGGQVKASYIDTKGLQIKDALGNVIFSSGVPLDWSRVAGVNRPVDGATKNLVTSGLLAARPAGANGDFYYATDTFTLYEKIAGAWVLASTVGAPAGTLINGVSAATVATAATNFNTSNDRNAAAVTAPTVVTNGNAVDHTIQTNGSADISFEWAWAGNEGDIDGFQVFVRQADTSDTYIFGTTPAEEAKETVYEMPAAKRALILYGVAPDKYYTFGVRAYRGVDKDINAAGVITSNLVRATRAEENPYQPSSTVAFAGNVTGSVNGIPAANVNIWSAISGAGIPENGATVGAPAGTFVNGVPVETISTAVANFNTTNDRNARPVASTITLTDGTSVDHALQPNGTADISFEWNWPNRTNVQSCSIVASISGTTMTVTSVTPGKLVNGMVLSGGAVTANTTISTQLTSTEPGGALGGKGTYTVSTSQTRASATLIAKPVCTGSISGTTLTVTASSHRALGIGAVLSGSTVAAGTYITSQLTSTEGDSSLGGKGTYAVSISQTVASSTIQSDLNEGDIDGFQVFVYQSGTNAAYTFGTTPELEIAYEVPAAKRAFILYGITPTTFYKFGVRAYRSVEKDIHPAGVIVGSIAVPTGSGENPYQPSTSLAFSGNVTGTVNGIPAANVNDWAFIDGVGIPEDGATKNVVFRQSTTPTATSVNDIWFNTATSQVRYWSGAAWVVAGDVTAQNTAAAIANQGSFATINQITDANAGTFVGNGAISATHIASLSVGVISTAVAGGVTSGGRIVIVDNVLRVYDNSNVMRVKLGNLA